MSSQVATRSVSGDEIASLDAILRDLAAAGRTLQAIRSHPLDPDLHREIELIGTRATGLARLAGSLLEPAGTGAMERSEPAVASAPAPPGTDRAAPPPLPDLSGAGILLFNPAHAARSATAQMLRHLGAEVSISEEAADALHLVATCDLDAVVLLLSDHPADAETLLRAIRKVDGPRGNVPVLAVATGGASERVQGLRDLGVSEVLETPIADIGALGGALTQMLRPAEEEEAVIRETLSRLLHVSGPSPRSDILSQLGSDLATSLGGLREALRAGDAEQARRSAHVLVSLAGTAGAGRLEAVARDLDHAARQGLTDPRVVALMTEAERRVEMIRDCLDDVLAQADSGWAPGAR